jgi:lysophospholipid acyltransferase (LPLAT)-like uncharacterized protein
MSVLRWIVAWMAAMVVLLLRLTCRVRAHDDPRPALRARGQPYVYSVLHAHQVAAVVGREPGTGAMVSRSADGAFLVPSLRVSGIVPVRGSSRHKGRDKGGRAALDMLMDHVRGGAPAYLAVDGPRGPRNYVNKGVAVLSQQTNAVVLNTAPLPTRRWILPRTWDRFQIPKPFSTIDIRFAEPLRPEAGESVEEYRQRIEASLNALEEELDAAEAARNRSAIRAQRVEPGSDAAAHRCQS